VINSRDAIIKDGHFVSPVFVSIEKGFWKVLGINAFSRQFFSARDIML
jgi:hypothetical protein